MNEVTAALPAPGPDQWTLVRGGRLVDGTQARPPATDLLLRGDTIHALGPPGLAAPAGARVVEAAGMLLHPGLVNAHTHGHGGLSRGMGDRWTLELLLTASPWTGGNRSLEDMRLSTLISASEMLLKGCTACYDLTFEFPCPSVEGMQASAAAYREAGLRALVAPMVADLSLYEAIPGLLDSLPPKLQQAVDKLRLQPAQVTLDALARIVRAWDLSDPAIRLAIAPTIPHHCTDGFLTGCRDLARAHGLPLHSHVSESKVQAVTGLRTYGTTLVRHLEKLGLLGPDFTVAHGVWLDDEDMRILAAHGASVAHNPGSNMRLGSGLADMRRMLQSGLNVGIGTDGSTSGDNQNMYEAMRLASFVSKVRGPDWQDWITTGEVLRAATTGSARALGFGDSLGRLAPGCKADIVFLDSTHINLVPLHDIVNSLVHAEDGGAVHSVMVGGRMVVANRRLLTVDTARLAREAEAAVERLERLNAASRALVAELVPLVGRYCPGLAAQPYHVHRYGACTHTH